MDPSHTDLSSATLSTLFAETAKAETSPAGGCVTAIGGYLGVSVILKCVRISARKRPEDTSYAESEQRLLAFADRLLPLAQADADSFAAFRTAIAMPKATTEEAATR